MMYFFKSIAILDLHRLLYANALYTAVIRILCPIYACSLRRAVLYRLL